MVKRVSERSTSGEIRDGGSESKDHLEDLERGESDGEEFWKFDSKR